MYDLGMKMNKEVKQLIDVYDVWYKPWWHSTYFYICIALLLIVTIVGIVYFLKKRYQSLKILSLDEIAILHLQEMLEQMYDSDDLIRDGYFKMTMIVKVYISKKYDIKLLGKTDQEIIESIKPVVPVEVYAPLQELFERSFQIKFARGAVSEKMLFEDVAFVQQIIEKMRAEDAQDAMGNS